MAIHRSATVPGEVAVPAGDLPVDDGDKVVW